MGVNTPSTTLLLYLAAARRASAKSTLFFSTLCWQGSAGLAWHLQTPWPVLGLSLTVLLYPSHLIPGGWETTPLFPWFERERIGQWTHIQAG